MAEAASAIGAEVVLSQAKRAVFRIQSWSLPSDKAWPRLLGMELPMRIGAISVGAVRMLCVGPRNWQVTCDLSERAHLEKTLEAQCRMQELEAIDLTSATEVFRVQGKASRDLLSKGCGIDLRANRFLAGHGARTRLAAVSVVLDCLDPSSRFDVYVASSYTAYLRLWLQEAALAFGAE
jgi:sarcosine oxidase subunit gamma